MQLVVTQQEGWDVDPGWQEGWDTDPGCHSEHCVHKLHCANDSFNDEHNVMEQVLHKEL